MENTPPITFLDFGDKVNPAVIFLHGFNETKELWTDFTQAITQKYRVVLIDLPGHGDNNKSRQEYSMDSAAEYVKEIVDQLLIQKFVIIGHSMGGYVGLAFAQKYPEMLSGLGLFHSSALPDSEEKKQARNKTIDFLHKHGVEVFMSTFVAPLFHESNRESQKIAIDELTKSGSKGTTEAVTGIVAAMRDRPDRIQLLKDLNVPVLFIAGKQDAAITLEQTLQQCHLPKISFTLFLDQTGHMGMFEKPKETLAAVSDFIVFCYS